MGRIVFLYFVQRKRWLGATTKNYTNGHSNFMSYLFDEMLEINSDSNYYKDWLRKLFFDTLNNNQRNDDFQMPNGDIVKIPYLNGGLFEMDRIESKLDEISIPNELFRNIENPDDIRERGYLDMLDSFNFTIYEDSPEDKTIAIDPEMLGHIFESLLEENREKGAFYTPKDKVHFMCRQSLLEYLCRKCKNSNDEKYRREIETLIYKKEIDENLTVNELEKINDDIDDVKICDPAIGSGAFPMGLLQEILGLKEILAYKLGKNWKPDEIKEHIIQNSIYGVDIESGAVDIARLRFWLSLVVDSEKPKPLPNLEYKIVTGDSLVSKFFYEESGKEEYEEITLDWGKSTVSEEHEQSRMFKQEFKKLENFIEEIQKEQNEFFHAEPKEKQKLRNSIRNLKADLLIYILEWMVKKDGISYKPDKRDKEKMKKWESSQRWENLINKLKEIKKDTNKPFKHFDWKLDFPEVMNQHINKKTGFDIVIGNPPYIQLQKNQGKLAKLYESHNFKTLKRTGDIYTLFYEKGVELLDENGILCYITSNKWMRAKYGKELREFLTEDTNPLLLIDFSGYKVFEAATVDTNIMLLEKAKNQNNVKACVIKGKDIQNIETYIKNNLSDNEFKPSASWVILSPIEKRIKNKVEEIGTPLKEWDINIYRGVLTGYNKAFIIDGEKRKELLDKDPKSDEIIRPILRGRDIKKYGYEYADLWLINTHNGIKSKGINRIDVDNYPVIKNHLDNYYTKLKKRSDKGDTPYNLRNCVYMEDFYKQKMVWKRVGSVLKFGFDIDKNFCLDSTCIATGKYIEFLVALMNSTLGNYLLRESPKTGTGDLLISVQAITPILVPNISMGINYKFSNIINKILEKQKNNLVYSDELEEIDYMIFKIYKLKTNEITFIQDSLKGYTN